MRHCGFFDWLPTGYRLDTHDNPIESDAQTDAQIRAPATHTYDARPFAGSDPATHRLSGYRSTTPAASARSRRASARSPFLDLPCTFRLVFG